MKTRLLAIVCAVAVGLLSTNTVRASTTNSSDVAADAMLVRPLCFLATVLGSAVFVVTLPFTAPCGGVHKAADALVVGPGAATFTRELGDFDSLGDDF